MVGVTCGGPCGFECILLLLICSGDGGLGMVVEIGIGAGSPCIGTVASLSAAPSVLVSYRANYCCLVDSSASVWSSPWFPVSLGEFVNIACPRDSHI